MLNIIQSFTESKGWKFGRLDGSTNVAARQRLVDNFNTDHSYYGMLMTTRTGGVGLNLTGADRIILYDPDWNPQTDAQARERAWRFGQEREVTIYRLIAAGTVEEKIYQRQIFKTALSNRVLQDPRQRRLFSQKDLKDLFSLKVDSGSVISGSEGLTETAQLTKGRGYVDPDEEGPEASANDRDDGETMHSVLKSKGLAGIFDHDMVESNKTSKKESEREMEENAKKVARAAVRALKESVAEPESSRFVARSGPASSSGLLASIRQQRDPPIRKI
jgi:DNA excision repair protein ERCC-6